MGRKYRQIHITGCSPRSGTTLMAELMVNGFVVDQFAEHEVSCFARPRAATGIVVTKNPVDIVAIRTLLWRWPHLRVLCMVRDPRDVVVSMHSRAAGRYYVGLNIWKEGYRLARRLEPHPRVRLVRYEDLVASPDSVQATIHEWLPFLEKRATFSEFHQVARPSETSKAALGGVRPVSPTSLGNWRKHKPRLAAQLERHGSITRDLIELGYEHDDRWLEELKRVPRENGISHLPDTLSRTKALGWQFWRWRNTVRAYLGIEARVSLQRSPDRRPI